jgi:3-keto-5-aminohexanoate cleavage enzyme
MSQDADPGERAVTTVSAASAAPPVSGRRKAPAGPVLVQVAINGGRDRREHPAIPYTPEEAATEAIACIDAGAALVLLRARGRYGAWSASPAWYSHAIRRIRHYRPDALIGIPAIRPETIPVDVILGLLVTLSNSAATRPDLLSVNLGHVMVWEAIAPGDAAAGRPIPRPVRGLGLSRRTVHYPSSYGDIVALLDACRSGGIVPELAIHDLGSVNNAVTLAADGLLPLAPWCRVAVDGPVTSTGSASAEAEDYDVLADRIARRLPGAGWVGHGTGRAGFAVTEQALVTGAHLRVGFEDSVVAPDGTRAPSNADLVAWAAGRVRAERRAIADAGQARRIIGAG